MDKKDKEVLELCKAWFEDIMERCDRLTSGNVSHGSKAIRGVAKNYADFVAEHLKEDEINIKIEEYTTQGNCPHYDENASVCDDGKCGCPECISRIIRCEKNSINN